LPYIEKINGKDALILQYIDGQSFMTKAFIDSLERDIQTYGASKYKPTIDEI
jgi:ABC-type maltose transport system permease subunit